MSRTNFYICGEQRDFEDLKKLTTRLKTLKCSVINPIEMPLERMSFYDRLQLIKKSDAIYVLPNWADDVMNRVELQAAMEMKIEALYHPVTNKEIKQLITTLDS